MPRDWNCWRRGAGSAQAVRNKAGASGVDWHRILVLQQPLLRKTITKKEREKESERGRERGRGRDGEKGGWGEGGREKRILNYCSDSISWGLEQVRGLGDWLGGLPCSRRFIAFCTVSARMRTKLKINK